MKVLLVVVCVLAAFAARAEDSVVKSCSAGDDRIEVLIDQAGVDISMKVQEVARKYTPEKGSSAYNILAAEGASFVIKDKQLGDFVKDKAVVSNIILTSLFGLRSLDGEYDMVHYYVDKYMHGLKCK